MNPAAETPIETLQWAVSPSLVPYPEAVKAMESRAAAIAGGDAPGLVWLLEHPSLYTAGVSARREDLLAPERFPVFQTGRGGQFTYHGPGQRVAYVMLDLRRRDRDVGLYVADLERWIIAALGRLEVTAFVRKGRIGVWVTREDGREEKIAAIGVRIRRWATFHGIALNVAPDLSHFSGIVPCGIRGHGVTSIADLGLASDMNAADLALKAAFAETFRVRLEPAPPPA